MCETCKKCPPPPFKKNPLSQELPKNEIQARNQCLQILIGSSLLIILHDKELTLKRSVSVIGSADAAFCDRPQKSWLEHP